jgi:hypothetical protein
MNGQSLNLNGAKRAKKKARFPLGQVVATPGALEALETAGQALAEFLRRHVTGDWGEVPPGMPRRMN